MKHIKAVDVPAKTVFAVDHVTCDICGSKIEAKEVYTVDEVEVRHKTGESYPDCGYGEEVSVDLCGKCFDEKLVPWLRSQGAEPVTKEWEW